MNSGLWSCAFQVDIWITTHFDFCFPNIYREPTEQNLASSFFLLVLAVPPCRWHISSLISKKIALYAMVRSDTRLRTVSCRHGIQMLNDSKVLGEVQGQSRRQRTRGTNKMYYISGGVSWHENRLDGGLYDWKIRFSIFVLFAFLNSLPRKDNAVPKFAALLLALLWQQTILKALCFLVSHRY